MESGSVKSEEDDPVIWKKTRTPLDHEQPLVHDGVAKGGNVCCSSRVSFVQQREL